MWSSLSAKCDLSPIQLQNLSKRGFCPATNFAFRDMICVHQVFVRNSNGADAQHEECGHDLLFALFYSTNHQPPLAPEHGQTKISYNKKLLVQCGSSNLTSKSREDYKHWTQDPRTQGPGTQGPKDQGPKDQGPKDQGPKDPRIRDPRTRDPRTRDLRTGYL